MNAPEFNDIWEETRWRWVHQDLPELAGKAGERVLDKLGQAIQKRRWSQADEG